MTVTLGVAVSTPPASRTTWALAAAGMPPTYFELLVLLSEAPERTVRMSELAQCTNSKPSRISPAIDELEQSG